MNISSQDSELYNKLRFISGIEIPQNTKLSQKLNDNDLLEFCRYGHPSVFKLFSKSPQKNHLEKKAKKNKNQAQELQLLKKLTKVKEKQTQNNCLHIAAQYGNLPLVRFLIDNPTQHKIDPNQTNARLENSLMVNLKYNDEPKADKISSLLLKYVDPRARDIEGKRAFEIDQAMMNPSRARILELIRKLEKDRNS